MRTFPYWIAAVLLIFAFCLPSNGGLCVQSPGIISHSSRTFFLHAAACLAADSVQCREKEAIEESKATSTHIRSSTPSIDCSLTFKMDLSFVNVILMPPFRAF